MQIYKHVWNYNKTHVRYRPILTFVLWIHIHIFKVLFASFRIYLLRTHIYNRTINPKGIICTNTCIGGCEKGTSAVIHLIMNPNMGHIAACFFVVICHFQKINILSKRYIDSLESYSLVFYNMCMHWIQNLYFIKQEI